MSEVTREGLLAEYLRLNRLYRLMNGREKEIYADTIAALERVPLEIAAAERRGMMRAAGIAEGYPAHQHGHLDADPHYAAQQAAHEIAVTIRATAAGEG